MVQDGDGRRTELAARRDECARARRSAAWVGVVVVALAGLAEDKAHHGWLAARGTGHTPWATSLLVLGVFMIALQVVALLLVLEHQVDTQPSTARFALGVLLLWLVRAAIVVACYVVLAWADPGDRISGWDISRHRTWAEAGGTLLALEGLVAGLLVIQWALSALREDRWDAPPAVPAGPDGGDPGPPGDPGRLVAVGASGGGIRATAFGLGGHQAVQDARARLGVADPEHEPHVFSVSGGSYLAAALALSRRYRPVHGADHDYTLTEPRPWAEAYAPDSLELERLRRHTRYLFEPGSRLRDGVVTLLVGATVNLFLLGTAVRFVVWVSTQLSVMLDLAAVRSENQGYRPVYHLHDHLGAVVGVPVVAGGAVVVLTLLGWLGASYFDGRHAVGSTGGVRRSAANALMGWSSRFRGLLVLAALGWLLLVLVIPGATYAVAKLAVDNHPTSTGARVIAGLGLVDKDSCAFQLRKHVEQAVTRAEVLASLNPGSRASVTAGACGVEVLVVRTADPDTGQLQPPTSGTDRLSAREQEAIDSYVTTTRFDVTFQIVGVGTLLSLVAMLLRRASSGASVAKPGRFAKVREKLLTWLPMTIMVVVLFYLSLLWTRSLLARVGGPYLTLMVGLTVLACFIAFLVDANITSLHRYYRNSLASAFAVGLRDEVAEELAPQYVYRFSELIRDGQGPRLHIITTLNTQTPGEAPTLRRGLPLVFAPGQVRLFRDRETASAHDTAAYEAFAGPGRVSVMATVGVSGAAVSPLSGRFAEQLAPYRVLLALFNLRLGAWTRNPDHTPSPGDAPVRRPWWRGPGVLWMTDKPGLAQMVLEAAGSSSAAQRWVYLSDGGHLDNTGLVECVRHALPGPGRILVMDASNDPADSWQAVGDAIAVVRADLGVSLVRVPLPGAPPWLRQYTGSGLDVLAVKAVRVERPGAGEDATWWDALPPDVQSFSADHPDFPRASTARQRFGDLEFEAYRALGYAAATTAFTSAWGVPP